MASQRVTAPDPRRFGVSRVSTWESAFRDYSGPPINLFFVTNVSRQRRAKKLNWLSQAGRRHFAANYKPNYGLLLRHASFLIPRAGLPRY